MRPRRLSLDAACRDDGSSRRQAPAGAKFWMKVFNDLKTRGVNDILIAVTDGLKGKPEALAVVTLGHSIALRAFPLPGDAVGSVTSRAIRTVLKCITVPAMSGVTQRRKW